MKAVLGYAHEIEERIGQGWTPHCGPHHPVMGAYDRLYYTREEHKMPPTPPKDQPLRDGDNERFGPARGQVNVWATEQHGRVELSFEGPFILDALAAKDFATWLTDILAPNIDSINDSLYEDTEAAE